MINNNSQLGGDKNEFITYTSGLQVKATPEEVNVVQVFSKILVEDYHYPKDCIQTHPQYRVKSSPSDTRYKYPIDITVFKTPEKNRGDEYIIVECKKPTREDGISQLKDYLKFSDAELGVWYNGESTHYIRKYFQDGHILFDEHIINIPQYNQRLEDIGLFKRSDLIQTHNLEVPGSSPGWSTLEIKHLREIASAFFFVCVNNA